MDFRGLDVSNSLELDKVCWHGCCLDGRKEACHDCLDSLTASLLSLLAPAQYIATKPGEEGPANYLATSAIISKGQYSFEAQCSLPCLTTRTAVSAHPYQGSPNIMAPNHLWGNWAKALLLQPLCIFKICRECT